MQLLKRFVTTLQTGLRILFPTCREASRLQSSGLDQPLPRVRRFGLLLHLAACKWCRRYGKQIRFLRQAAEESPGHVHEHTPRGLSPEAKDRLKRALQSKGE